MWKLKFHDLYVTLLIVYESFPLKAVREMTIWQEQTQMTVEIFKMVYTL